MEHVGAISGGEWNSSNGMCSEEAEFMAQLFGNCALPNDVPNCSNFTKASAFWPNRNNECSFYSSNETNTSMYSFSQGSGFSGGSSSMLFPIPSNESYHPSVSRQGFLTNNNLMTMDCCMIESKNNSSRIHVHSTNAMEWADLFLNQTVSNDSIKSNENVSEDVLEEKSLQLAMPVVELPKEDNVGSPSGSRKRSRFPGEVQGNKRSMKMDKCPELEDNKNNNEDAVVPRRSLSSCCLEDDSSASGKTRASRGSATDPQSLYARKRRERINERLRILQKLVPNGTKVDISTMLEEDVHYVKFLQLQIKLLSSDELWMYAPIAYNGMDIGLDLKTSTPKPQS